MKFDLRRSQGGGGGDRKIKHVRSISHPPPCIRQVKPIACTSMKGVCLFQCADNILILISTSLLIKTNLLIQYRDIINTQNYANLQV